MKQRQKSWAKSKLASAFEVLKPGQCDEKKKAAGLDLTKDYTQDVKCLKCHTTAYGTASGYPAPTEGKAFTDEEKTRAALNEGVTCEACHGPGSLYIPIKKANKEYKLAEIVAVGALAPVKAENCAACHANECPTMPKDYKFDFETEKKSDKMHAHKALKSEQLDRALIVAPDVFGEQPTTDGGAFHPVGVPLVNYLTAPFYLFDSIDTLDKIDVPSLVPVTRATIRLIESMRGVSAAAMREGLSGSDSR